MNPSDDVKGLLADFYLSHAVPEVRLPLRVTWLHGFCNAQSSAASAASAPSDAPDPIHTADVIVKDSDGAVVFDSTAAATFREAAWGTGFRLYEWVGAAAVCRALVRTDAGRVIEMELVPENGVLDERTHDRLPERLNSITVNGVTFSGEVEFVAGYNLAVTRAPALGRSRRARNRVVFAAAPGAGEGRFPSCDEPEQAVRRINGVGPNATGDFVLSAADCYWLERPVESQGATATLTPATLRLNNDCGACCECRDYEKTYQGVRRLYERFRALGDRATAVRTQFKDNINRWLAQRECRIAAPTRVNGVAAAGNYLAVAASWCNEDDDCKYEVDLKITVTHSRGLASSVVACQSTATRVTGGVERIEPYGSDPTYGHYWSVAARGRGLVLRTMLRFAGTALPGDSATVTATPYVGGVARTAASVTLAMYPCGATA